MKKEFTLIIICVCSGCMTFGQTPYADSLRTLLPTTSVPFEEFRLLDQITLEMVNTVGNNVDSTMSFRMLEIAQDLRNDSLLAIAFNWLGTYFYVNKGDHATGIEYYYKGIPLAQKAGDLRRVSSLYFDIAIGYYDMGNVEEAFKSTLEGGRHLPPKSSPMYYYMLSQYQSNMALYFLLDNQPDSALYYSKALQETNTQLPEIVLFRLNELIQIGASYGMLGEIAKADAYFSRGKVLIDSVRVEAAAALYQFMSRYVPFLLKSGRMAEAEEQSRALMQLGTKNNNNPNIKIAGARLLREVFEARRQMDSAYHYSRMESELNDRINSERNKNKFQTLAINKQLWRLDEERERAAYENQIKLYGAFSVVAAFLIIAFILFRNNRQKEKANNVLEATLANLKSTQTQLIQSEKMASLGELTAGIAHEIQNPLNFVNNFSEVNTELINELKEAVAKGRLDDVKSIAATLEENENKIVAHGKRADAIVKGMLQHSRKSSGQKEPTDINALCDEYLRLAYHGLRAKDKTFNAKFETQLDPTLPKVNVVPQEIGRVVLNLINNAFYAVDERKKSEAEGYEPTVVVSTSLSPGEGRGEARIVQIKVTDNGNGIPASIKDKIFQPFFTTKPTGQGTGLGLSLSYDIVTKGHGGELKVVTKEGEGSEFIVALPA
jgi:signal transduction histidine kinase